MQIEIKCKAQADYEENLMTLARLMAKHGEKEQALIIDLVLLMSGYRFTQCEMEEVKQQINRIIETRKTEKKMK